jgi:hypothetical protein
MSSACAAGRSVVATRFPTVAHVTTPGIPAIRGSTPPTAPGHAKSFTDSLVFAPSRVRIHHGRLSFASCSENSPKSPAACNRAPIFIGSGCRAAACRFLGNSVCSSPGPSDRAPPGMVPPTSAARSLGREAAPALQTNPPARMTCRRLGAEISAPRGRTEESKPPRPIRQAIRRREGRSPLKTNPARPRNSPIEPSPAGPRPEIFETKPRLSVWK